MRINQAYLIAVTGIEVMRKFAPYVLSSDSIAMLTDACGSVGDCSPMSSCPITTIAAFRLKTPTLLRVCNGSRALLRTVLTGSFAITATSSRVDTRHCLSRMVRRHAGRTESCVEGDRNWSASERALRSSLWFWAGARGGSFTGRLEAFG